MGEMAEWLYWLFTYKEGNKYVGMHKSKNSRIKTYWSESLPRQCSAMWCWAGSLPACFEPIPGPVSFIPFWGL